MKQRFRTKPLSERIPGMSGIRELHKSGSAPSPKKDDLIQKRQRALERRDLMKTWLLGAGIIICISVLAGTVCLASQPAEQTAQDLAVLDQGAAAFAGGLQAAGSAVGNGIVSAGKAIGKGVGTAASAIGTAAGNAGSAAASFAKEKMAEHSAAAGDGRGAGSGTPGQNGSSGSASGGNGAGGWEAIPEDAQASAEGTLSGDKDTEGAGNSAGAGSEDLPADGAKTGREGENGSGSQKNGSAGAGGDSKGNDGSSEGRGDSAADEADAEELTYQGVETDQNIMLETARGPIPYYNQEDSHWENHLYGGADPMYGYGCGPTALAMIIGGLSDSTVSPADVADYAAEHDEFEQGYGSRHSIVMDVLTAYGIQVRSLEQKDADGIERSLSQGHLVIALMGPGTFTDAGHFLILTDRTGKGQVSIADPKSRENTLKSWDLSTILEEVSDANDHGAPLWEVIG